jgi:hypothetical protein
MNTLYEKFSITLKVEAILADLGGAWKKYDTMLRDGFGPSSICQDYTTGTTKASAKKALKDLLQKKVECRFRQVIVFEPDPRNFYLIQELPDCISVTSFRNGKRGGVSYEGSNVTTDEEIFVRFERSVEVWTKHANTVGGEKTYE